MKRIFLTMMALLMIVPTVGNTEIYTDGKTMLENIRMEYDGKEIVLSDQVQIVWHDVNFRTTPGGKVICRFQGGEILNCPDETQYKGQLWYHVLSPEFGDGYVNGTYAKPLWDNLSYWPLPESGDILTDNMILFSYWFGTYQLDHGLSIIEDVGTERQLIIAPLSVRGNLSIIPDDMKIQLVLKMFEYGLICKSPAYDQLTDTATSVADKNTIASKILQKHYGTDDIWEIIIRASKAVFIHINDLHTLEYGIMSGRDRMLEDALLQKVIDEH